MKTKKSLPSILSDDDKKYLRSYTRYLKALGMREGLVEFEVDEVELNVDWNHFTHFSNNYKIEITSELQEIFQKIFDFISEEDLIEEPEHDIDYRRIEIEIDCRTEAISVSDYYTYYEPAETQSIFYDDPEQVKPLFDSIGEVFKSQNVLDRQFTLGFNGSGDSGYIEDNFDNAISVPANVEDWCYRELENHFGGWEINEGSQGEFIFDVNEPSITLNFTSNIEEQITNTIFEEKFSN